MNFQNKTVVVTGGNAGIGAATIKSFLAVGAKVASIDLATDLADEFANLPAAQFSNLHYYTCDVSNFDQVSAVYKQIITDLSGIDVTVNNAGILGPRVRSDEYPVDDFARVIDVNVKGVWYCMKAALQHFAATKKAGVIVNTASVAGHLGMAGHIAYSASKHAVVGMTKTAAVEYGKFGIRVNAVCPGFTETAMLHSDNADDQYRDMLQFATPMKRFGKPEEIAAGILYLASDTASFMNGQSLILDGGLSVQ